MPTTTVSYTNIPGRLGGPLSFHRYGQSKFILPDFQGHARQLTDSTGAVTDTFTPDAWGVQKAATGNTVNPFKAFGKWGYFTDTPTRHYARARELAPSLGRFFSRDPHMRASTFGGYKYVQNRPVMLADPSVSRACIIPRIAD